MQVMIIRRWNTQRHIYKLVKLDRKHYSSDWFRTLEQAKNFCKEKNLTLIERPDLIKKWNEAKIPKTLLYQ